MGVLHLVSRSPYFSLDLAKALSRLSSEDALLLLANAVYGACPGSPVADSIQASQATRYVLIPDLKARGITPESLLPEIIPVEFEGFVDLTVAYSRILTW